MSTTIDSLELQIQSNAQQASTGLDALESSLRRIREATSGNIGLSNLSRQLTNLNTALSTIPNSMSNKLEKIAYSLVRMSSIGSVSIPDSIATQLTRISDAVNALDVVNFDAVPKLAESLSSLSNVGEANIDGFVNQIRDISTVIDGISGDDISRLSGKIQDLTNAFRPLAEVLRDIANGFAALPDNIRNVIQQTNNVSRSNDRASNSYINLAARIGTFIHSLTRVYKILSGFTVKSGEYIESLNLFTASMGQYASEAQEYAEQVSEIMGIDPAEWMRSQGVFMTLATGFGVAGDKAALMSKNLTQLGYDMASFFNMPVEETMQKLQSALAGELEPVRRVGYDLSQAALKQIAADADNYTSSIGSVTDALSDANLAQLALNQGIGKSYNEMTQAEKSQLRYIALMNQVTVVQGDMARTLDSPANQMRILKAQFEQCARAIGNLFLPALQAILPVAIAVAKVIRYLAEMIAGFFGIKISDFGGVSESMTVAAGGAGNIEENLGGAAKKAKELKNALLGIDELNIISEPDASGGGGGDFGGGGSSLDFKLPEYDFLAGLVESKVDGIVQKMKEWLGITDDITTWSDLLDTRLEEILDTAIAIGIALGAWKIAKGIITLFDKLQKLLGAGGGFGALGAITFLSDLNELMRYFEDFEHNGATFENVIGMITEFVGMLGDAFILLGNVKLGGVLKVVQGVEEIVIAIMNISENGMDWDNAMTAIRGLTNFAIGVGVLSGNLKVAAWAVAIQGFTSVIRELADNWDAIKEGDWSGVDKVTLAISAIEILGGLAVALDAFSKIKGISSVGNVSSSAESISTATGGISTNLTSLAKNIGMGLVILLEVAAAAAIFVGAIILIGYELQAVASAWQPVIENIGTVLIALGIGTALLAVVGAACFLLSKLGVGVILDIAIGAAVLLEIGVATALFLAEILVIGLLLDEVGKAWQPVLDNGETIALGIGLGTALLIGIGAATALLGAATVASAGALPLAIGLGTAILVELAAATIVFCESLVAVADELSFNLAPALNDLNDELPNLIDDMSAFVDFMCEFADEVVRYTLASSVSGLAATIDTIIGWFTQDPIEKLSSDVEKIGDQASTLTEKLLIANPELETALSLLRNYVGFVDELGKLSGKGGTTNLSDGLKANLNTVGQDIVTGFSDGIASKYPTIESTITEWADSVLRWFNDSSFGNANDKKFAQYATEIVNGFRGRVASSYPSTQNVIVSWASGIRSWFASRVSYSTFYELGRQTIQGYDDGVGDFVSSSLNNIRYWSDELVKTIKEKLGIHSPSRVFGDIAENCILGYNNTIEKMGGSTIGVMDDWSRSISSVNPSMVVSVDTSALKYYSGRSIETDITSNSSVVVTGFVEGMEEFYREYVEETIRQMAEDVRRQADKNEQTVVTIGNRTISDAVNEQRKANGYVFAV